MFYYKLKNKEEYDFLVASFLAAGWKECGSGFKDNTPILYTAHKKFYINCSVVPDGDYKKTSSPKELLEKCGIKQKAVKKYKAGDHFDGWEKLAPFPEYKTAKKLGLKVGDLVVLIDVLWHDSQKTGITKTSGNILKITDICLNNNDEYAHTFFVKDNNGSGRYAICFFAPLPDTPKKTDVDKIMEESKDMAAFQVEYKMVEKPKQIEKAVKIGSDFYNKESLEKEIKETDEVMSRRKTLKKALKLLK